MRKTRTLVALALRSGGGKAGLLFSLLLLLLCLLPASPVALSQTKPILERRGALEFGGQHGRITAHKFLGDEKRLLLVGYKITRLLDVLNARL
jgi:hypothetical protein